MADFVMPSLGADMTAGILVAWRVEEGDQVENGDIIAEVETEKGLFEVEVYAAGVVDKLLLQPGPEKVPVGTVLATIGSGAAVAKALIIEPGERLKISPVARKLAAEKNIDISHIQRTGSEGPICLANIEVEIRGNSQRKSSFPPPGELKKTNPISRMGMRPGDCPLPMSPL